MRCAIYFVPPPDDPLTVAAAEWLCRAPAPGETRRCPIDGLTEADHAFLTALPRRSGFHATLKPPFVLAEDKSVFELERRLAQFCQELAPVHIESRIALVENFFAIVPARPAPELDMLAARIVTEFDAYRSPMSDADLERRSAVRLTGRQLANLRTWGHPFVFDQFRFHMTLTGPVDRLERDHVKLVLDRHFGGRIGGALEIGQLALAVEPEPHARFELQSTHGFRIAHQLRIA